MRQCKKCLETKPLTDFSVAPQCKEGRRYECKLCRSAREKANWDANSHRRSRSADYKRAERLRRLYDLTPEQYDAKLEEQGGVCEICGDLTSWNRREGNLLVVDHSHETNEVRGLLCHPCNQALGMMRDNPDLLRAAADYLDKYKQMPL